MTTPNFQSWSTSQVSPLSLFERYLRAALLAVCLTAPAFAQEVPEPPTPELPGEPAQAPDAPELDVERTAPNDTGSPYHRRLGAVVRFGSNAHVRANESADAAVSIFGSSTSEGEIRDAIVSIFGDTRALGPVGDAAVAIFGNVYINGSVGEVVAVFGDVELGPQAEIRGETVLIGGMLKSDAAAVMRGEIQEITLPWNMHAWLRPWVEHCLMLGRPLAFAPGLEWAWTLAVGFLAFYVLLALMFPASVERCARTLETRPGESVIASVAMVFLTPVFFILLFVTVLGILLVPFLNIAFFIAGLFGKAAVLATLGRRITRFAETGPLTHVASAVVVGGILVTALYVVPVVGFIAYMATGVLGIGVVAYTLTLASQARRATTTAAGGPALAGVAAGGTAAQSSIDPASAPAASLDATTLPRATFLPRMGALLIDAVLIGIIANFIPGSGDIWLLLLGVYGALMWRLRGTTVGGIILNLRVVRVDGREIDWATAIVRALGCYLSAAAVGLGFIWIAIDPERQGWHDKIAGTVVVRTPRPGSLV